MRMRHIVICGLSDSTIFFPHYLINGTILEEKLSKRVRFDFLYNFRHETFFVQRIIERGATKNVYRSSRKVPIIPVRMQSVL